MRLRILPIITACWWTLWTVVIVPMHTRGAIPLATAGCPMCAACCEKPQAPSSHTPSKDPSENCAVCHIVATLATTPVLPLFTHHFLMIGRLETPIDHPPLLETAPEQLLCRGPPSV